MAVGVVLVSSFISEVGKGPGPHHPVLGVHALRNVSHRCVP
jgi:hypothetical protein